MSIRSRGGNVVLAVVGAVYAVSALVALAMVLRNAFAARALLDAFLQVVLATVAGCGIWFILVALDNLGVLPHGRRVH